MNLIEKYIKVVTNHLKEEQRDEIARELQANINDMLEERCEGREVTQSDIEAVLLELGDPKKLAENYKGAPKYLIGEELYGIYRKVLRIVLICVLIGSVIGTVVTIATEQDLSKMLEEVLSIGGNLLGAFASVTIIFALLERNEIKIKREDVWKEAAWHPDMLDKQLQQETKGRSCDHICEIALDVIILLMLNTFPDKFGVFYKTAAGNLAIIQVFNLEELHKFIWVINVILIVSLIYHCVHLFVGRQTLGLLIFHTLIKIAECVQVVILFRFPGIWNTRLLDELNANAVLTFNGEIAYKGMEQGINIFVGVIILLSVINIGKEVYYYVKSTLS